MPESLDLTAAPRRRRAAPSRSLPRSGETAKPAKRSPAAITAVLALAGLCSSVMFTLIIPVQSRLPELLHASPADTPWAVTATLLAAAIITPIAGRLGDLYGKKRIILILLGVMILGSIVAGLFSTNLVGLVIGRAMQGAASGVIPLGIASLKDLLAEGRADSAIATVSATLGVGGAIGLPIAAAISEYGDWRWMFWVSGALGLVVMLLITFVVPESKRGASRRFDVVGAIGMAVGLAAILIAISRGPTWGWSSPAVLALLIGGGLWMLGWGWYELRIAHPLLDLRVAARAPVLVTNIASLATGFAMFTQSVTFPQLLQAPVGAGGFGLTLLQAGLICMPLGLMMMAVSPLAGRVSRLRGPRLPFSIGVAVLVVAYGLLLIFLNSPIDILIASALAGLGIGMAFAAMPNIIMRSVPSHETGASNGLNTLFRSTGTTLAGTVIGVLLAALSTPYQGVPVPTPAGFHAAIALGAGIAVVAFVLSLLIPKPTMPARELIHD
ncbi:MAG: MFS transporter [Humibacter sp.]